MPESKHPLSCALRGGAFPSGAIYPLAAVRPTVYAEIERDHPELGRTGYICQQDLATYRTRYV